MSCGVAVFTILKMKRPWVPNLVPKLVHNFIAIFPFPNPLTLCAQSCNKKSNFGTFLSVPNPLLRTPPKYYWLQPSCWSSKFSSSFPATSVLFYAGSNSRDSKVFLIFPTNVACKLWSPARFLHGNDVIDLCWMLCNNPGIVPSKEKSLH